MALFSRDKQEEVPTKDQPKKPKAPAKQAPKKAKAAEVSSTKPAPAEQAISHQVLRRALITEKGTLLAGDNKVLFEVPVSATKQQVKQAVFEAYGIRPTSVRTAVFAGKQRRFRTTMGKRRDWKKAIVTLPEGTSIAPNEAV